MNEQELLFLYTALGGTFREGNYTFTSKCVSGDSEAAPDPIAVSAVLGWVRVVCAWLLAPADACRLGCVLLVRFVECFSCVVLCVVAVVCVCCQVRPPSGADAVPCSLPLPAAPHCRAKAKRCALAAIVIVVALTGLVVLRP